MSESPEQANAIPSNEEPDPRITERAITFQDSDLQGEEILVTSGFDIKGFRADILKNGLVSSNSYKVKFYPFRANGGSPTLNKLADSLRSRLTFRCENVLLPTVSLLQEENIRRYGYGPVEKVPYGVQFNEVTLTFIEDQFSDINNFFYQWLNTIINYESSGGQMRRGVGRESLNEFYSAYEVGYRDSYAMPKLDIEILNYSRKVITVYSLYEVFPTDIQSVNLSYADENQTLKMTVTLAFTDMATIDLGRTSEEIEAENNENGEPQRSSKEEKPQPTNVGADNVRNSTGTAQSANASKPLAGEAKPPKSSPGSLTLNTVQVKNTFGNPVGIA